MRRNAITSITRYAAHDAVMRTTAKQCATFPCNQMLKRIYELQICCKYKWQVDKRCREKKNLLKKYASSKEETTTSSNYVVAS